MIVAAATCQGAPPRFVCVNHVPRLQAGTRAALERLGDRTAFETKSNRTRIKEARLMIGIIVWLIVGGVVGWLASIVMRTDAQQGILLNIVVGIVGAFLAGLVVGGGSINQGITLTSFLVSLVGAIVLLAIVNLFRRGAVR
jgi:uncharacterized membrane protein YeaQ/YmgE (transglycosylase-associated protein family)